MQGLGGSGVAPPDTDLGQDPTAAGGGDAAARTGHRHRTRRRRRRWAASAASFAALLFALISLNFLLPRLMPGDPIDGLIAQSATNFTFGEESRAALKQYYGVDKPLPQQYRHYLARLGHGDLGRSIATHAPVTSEISRRLPWTLLLMATSIVLTTAVGGVAGVQGGWKRGRSGDRTLLVVLLAAREFPAFLLGSMLVFGFAVKLRWFPSAGAETAFATYGPLAHVFDVAKHLVLPVLVLTVGLAAGTFLVTRAGMVDQLGADHLVWGRARGLRERRLKYRYAARNALLPVLSVTALQVGFLVTGDVLVERVFAYPGIGNLIFESINGRDYPVIQGCFLVVSVTVVSVNALADALYRRLDPRTAP